MAASNFIAEDKKVKAKNLESEYDRKLKDKLTHLKHKYATAYDLLKIQTLILHNSPFPKEPILKLLKLSGIKELKDFMRFDNDQQTISLVPDARKFLTQFFNNTSKSAEILTLVTEITQTLIMLYQAEPTDALLKHSQHLLDNHKIFITPDIYAELKSVYDSFVPVQVVVAPEESEEELLPPVTEAPTLSTSMVFSVCRAYYVPGAARDDSKVEQPIAEEIKRSPSPLPPIPAAAEIEKTEVVENKSNKPKKIIRPPKQHSEGLWYLLGGGIGGMALTLFVMRDPQARQIIDKGLDLVVRKFS